MMQLKKSKKKQRLNFPAIGTEWQIDIYDSLTDSQFLALENKLHTRINQFDKNYSRFRKDSWISKISTKTGKFSMPVDFFELISTYDQLNNLSNGLFTPLIGQTLVDAGYDASYSLMQKKKLVSPPEFEKTIQYSDSEIILAQKALLDFGAAGKGYLIDIIGQLIEGNNVTSYCIDAGGDILYKSKKIEPLRVGLEHPNDPSMAIGVVNIINQSICGSAGNRRKWENFHHTINPHTLTSPEDITATWVIADKAILADGLSTCLFLDHEIKNYMKFKFDYVIMYKDNTIIKSPGIDGEFYTA